MRPRLFAYNICALTVNCELITRLLIEHVYPAMLAQCDPSTPREELARSMLLIVARRMASARGLDGSVLPNPGQWALPDLQDIDFRHVDVTVLGDVHSTLLSGRHRRGSYYTPLILAECVARQVISPREPAQRILDPAMGSGHFLIAAAGLIAGWAKQTDERQARWSALGNLCGVDNDPIAVELASISLWLWAACPGTAPSMLLSRLACGDALLDDRLWKTGLAAPFDAVVGNPPYTSAITRARARDAAYRSALQSRYHTARGSFDLSVPFVEQAVRLCRDGGRCGLVLPNKLLAADYARPLRSWLAEQITVEAIIDTSQQKPFAAGVYPITVIFRNTPPSADRVGKFSVGESPSELRSPPSPARPIARTDPHSLAVYRWNNDRGLERVRTATQADLHTAPGGSWSCVLNPAWDKLRRCWQHSIPLGDVARLAGGLTVGEAYSLRPAVFDASEDGLPENAFRLLTSGLIRRYDNAWGQTRATFLKATYQRPALAAEALPVRRREQAAARKIIVAGMGKTPRALVDCGQAQASVSTTIIIDTAWPLDALCAILNSRLVGGICQAVFGGLALSGGHMRFGKPELAHLPLPAVDASDPRLFHLDVLSKQRSSTASGSLAQDIEENIEALIYTLYSQTTSGRTP